jgi:phosphoglycolate phosphatase-like HAD superfamily hydrolase
MLTLWDIDGTLVSTGGAGLRALDRACHELFGIEGAMRDVRADGKTDPLIVDEIFEQHRGRPATIAEREKILARYVECLSDEVARTERYVVLPGVEKALDAARARGATIGLATGNVEHGARIKLLRGDLWRHFAFGGYGSDAAERAALVARAIERGEAHAGRSFARRDIIVIGDTPRDVAAAHACGAFAIAVATGPHDTTALAKCGADVVMETLDELPAWLARG